MILDKNGVIVSATEPAKNRRKYWHRKGKNLLNIVAPTQTVNGVTITQNADGSVTLNGTATTGTALRYSINLNLQKGTYTHSITNKVAGTYFSLDNVALTMLGQTNQLQTNKTFEIIEKTTYSDYLIWIDKNTTFNNYIFYPMLCEGTDTVYEKYIEPTMLELNLNGEYVEWHASEFLDVSRIKPITPTHASVTNHPGYGNSYYYKIGSKVHVHLGLKINTTETVTICTLPQGYRPYSSVALRGIGSSVATQSGFLITSTGEITVNAPNGYGCVDIDFDAVS